MTGFTFNTDHTLKDLRSYQYRVSTALADIFSTKAEKTTAEMKEGVGVPHPYVYGDKDNNKRGQLFLIGKPWVDRTGKAKQELKAVYIKSGTKYILRLQHGVDYGIWLEFANEKRFAIILPTLRRIQPNFIAEIKRLLGKIQVK